MKSMLIVALLVQAVCLQAQPGDISRFPVKGKLVTVTDWGSRSLYMSNTFFSETKDSIRAQIGQLEYEEMIRHCNLQGWPDGFYKAELAEEDDKAFDTRLNKLKMYRIATYTHRYNGKVFDRYVILRVPYAENRNWDPSVKWEGNVYFLLKEQDVQALK